MMLQNEENKSRPFPCLFVRCAQLWFCGEHIPFNIESTEWDNVLFDWRRVQLLRRHIKQSIHEQ